MVSESTSATSSVRAWFQPLRSASRLPGTSVMSTVTGYRAAISWQTLSDSSITRMTSDTCWPATTRSPRRTPPGPPGTPARRCSSTAGSRRPPACRAPPECGGPARTTTGSGRARPAACPERSSTAVMSSSRSPIAPGTTRPRPYDTPLAPNPVMTSPRRLQQRRISHNSRGEPTIPVPSRRTRPAAPTDPVPTSAIDDPPIQLTQTAVEATISGLKDNPRTPQQLRARPIGWTRSAVQRLPRRSSTRRHFSSASLFERYHDRPEADAGISAGPLSRRTACARIRAPFRAPARRPSRDPLAPCPDGAVRPG